MPQKSKQLQAALQAAQEAGKILMQHYGRLKNIQYKAENETVTEADQQSEKRILSILKKAFPEYSIIAEESGTEETASPYCWLIDPLDGTSNFVMQNPFFNVSIGLAYQEEPILGVVYNPYTKELFYAEKGCGVWMNGKRIAASKQAAIDKAIIGFCHTRGRENVLRALQLYQKLKLITNRVRQFGSAALELAYVAAGRIDAFYMTNTHPHDVAAGAVIAQEAGCKVTDFAGKPFTVATEDILVSNPQLYETLRKLLQP
ncbi:inositol monophosphatase [Candidatus Woesearchaeota archaeon]|nr:inositol monophosphatase [Candidatus Woesearchaeota archaeon]